MIKKIILSLVFVTALFSGLSISAKPVSAVGCDINSITSFTTSPTSGKAGDWITISWVVKPGCQDGVLELSPGNLAVANQPSGSYSYQLTGPPETYYLSVCDGTVPGQGFGKCGVPYYNSGMVAADFAQVTVGTSLQPATLTVNVVDENDTPLSGASWDVFGGSSSPSPSSGSGTSVAHTIYPANGGSSFSVANISPIPNRTLSVSNSDFGGSTIMVAPGQSKSVKLKYSATAQPCTVNLYTNTNSIVSGNSATLTWSSTNTVSPFTSGTNFNTANAQANMVGVTVNPTVTTTYSIRGYDSGVGCNDAVTITVTAPPPPTITSFSATPSCTAGNVSEILLGWSGTNVTSYTVQRNNSGGATIYSGSGTSYTDSSRTASQTYTYYLTATGPGGSVNQTASATANNCSVPTPPVMISVTPTPSCNGTTPEMQLVWSASNSPTSYTVKRNNAGGATIYSGAGTSYTDPSLTPSTSYTYYVTATNADGTSGGMTGTATTGSCVGQAPTVSVTAAPPTVSSGGQSNINWSIGGGTATGCTMSANPGNAQWSGNLSAPEITSGGHYKTISNITVNTTFSLFCSNANGGNSSSDSVTVSALGSPVVTISASPGTVSNGNSSNLTWSVTNSPTSCTASGGWSGAKASSGTNVSTGALFSNTTFTLTCTNGSGSGSNSANVIVTGGGLPDYSTSQPATITLVANDPNSRITGSMYNLSSNSGGGGNYTFQVATASNGGGVVTTLSPDVFLGPIPGNYSYYEGFNKVYTFSTTGTYSRRICVDATGFSTTGPNPTATGGVVNESDESNNCSPWGDIIVTSGTMDVLAGPTYTTFPAGVNNMNSNWYFGAFIKNQGTGATPGTGFPNIGQLATQPNGGGTITNFSYSISSTIAPGGQSAVSFGTGYTFGTPGTYSTRVCADGTGVSGNTPTGGTLIETDELNNCGPWTDLVVTADATSNTNAYINVYSNLASSWDIIPWPSSGQTVNPTSGSGTQSNHTASGGSYTYTLSNILSIPNTTYTVTPSTAQNIYGGRTYSYWINYISSSSFNYSLSNGGTVSITKSSVPVSGQASIVKTLTAGATQSVDMTATGMPAGVTVAYAARNCSPTCTTTITFTIDPTTAPGTYPITVTGNTAGLANKTTSFNLVVTNPVTLTVSCTPTPSPAYVGQPVTWTGSVVGGTPPYTYAWTGSDFGTGITNPFVFTYQSTGTKNATLTATDSLSVSGTCPATNLGVTIDPKYKEF